MRALEFLERDRLLHMGMIFPVMRGSVEIVYEGRDGVLLRETESGAYMMSMSDRVKGTELLDQIGRQELVCLHQQWAADHMAEYGYEKSLVCVQAVYEKKEPVALGKSLDIRALNAGHIDEIYAVYNKNVSYEYLKERLGRGALYGAYAGAELVGFGGTHAEGSIGILEIFDSHRGRGFGAELLGFVTNAILESGQIPFSQVTIGNKASMRLHQKLRFTMSDKELYWLF